MTAKPEQTDEQPGHSTPTPRSPPVPFEVSLAELGTIVGRLESGALGLSDSIGAYEQGVSILRTLHQQLAAVEERVRMLVRIDDQGRPILEATAEPTSGTDPAADAAVRKTARPGAKSVRAKRLPGMDDASGDVYDSTS